MVVLRCKCCDDEIVLLGNSLGRCESCGTIVTLPKINDEKIARMYDRANHFRKVGDFDLAYKAYEQIVTENRYDAEAHWCLTLCRFGVNYVKDSRSVNYLPTVSRMSYDSILEDRDYLAALKYSDEETAKIYRKEAKRIATIQERYLKIARTEEPYDVFICFKAEEENRKRTEGSVKAQELYEMLTNRGLRVFFSRITLEDKISEEYEPYIFAALSSAKVMLVVANKKEHLEARWVKNEWMRFLSMMDVDHSKHMVPIYVNMEPEDFPAEIPKVQGKKINDVGAMAVIVSNVLELTGKKEKLVIETQEKERPEVAKLLERIEIDLEDDDFAKAEERIKDILKEEPENGEAFYYQFLIKNKVNRADKLLDISYDWSSNSEFCKVLEGVTGKHKKELMNVLECSVKEQEYREAVRLKKCEQFADALELFQKLGDYRDSVMQCDICQKELEHIQEDIKNREILQENIVAYNKELGDKNTYIKRKIQAEHPEVIRKYEKLHKAYLKSETMDGKGWTLFWAILLVGVSVWCMHTMSSLGAVSLDVNAFTYFNMGFSLLTILCCYVCFDLDLEDIPWWIYVAAFVLLYLGYCYVPYFLIGHADSFLPEAMMPYVGMCNGLLSFLIGLIFLIVGIYPILHNANASSAQMAWKEYEEKVVKPLEETYRNEINQKYEPIIGKKNLLTLRGITK